MAMGLVGSVGGWVRGGVKSKFLDSTRQGIFLER